MTIGPICPSQVDTASVGVWYLDPLVSEDLPRACAQDGRKVSAVFEEAVNRWLDERGRG
ncbi:MAG: hypothetical protein JWM10_3155 [Myxococcaceae bacterium]|nr:hypothetical protein [Myxococcaceae bacterium]